VRRDEGVTQPVVGRVLRRGSPLVLGILQAVAVAAATGGMANPARAQVPGGDEDLPAIRLSGAGVDLLKLAVPRAEGDGESARTAVETLSKDMDVSGLFQVLDPASFPQQLQTEGLAFSSALWTQVGAQAVLKMKATGNDLEGKLFVVARGDTAVLSRSYRSGHIRDSVHEFANDVLQSFTGTRGVFGSRIVFAQSGHGSHEIASVDMDGGRMTVLTNMQSDCLLPAYSPSGGEVAFTSYLRNNPDMWIVSSGGGRARRTSKQPGMNTGAAWSPDGGSIALTLSYQGNSELYRISPTDGTIKSRLTNNPTIDSSPNFSPDGGQVAFVSNRQGTPQIFVMPASGGSARRVTYQGKYNQTPHWNPDPNKPQIAFTGRDERGVFDIFFIDIKTQQVTRITQGKGSNMDPAWSPDGRLLVYASSRGGLFINNPQTRHEVQITRGAASSPSWGPAPKR
jgi:TolB protein